MAVQLPRFVVRENCRTEPFIDDKGKLHPPSKPGKRFCIEGMSTACSIAIKKANNIPGGIETHLNKRSFCTRMHVSRSELRGIYEATQKEKNGILKYIAERSQQVMYKNAVFQRVVRGLNPHPASCIGLCREIRYYNPHPTWPNHIPSFFFTDKQVMSMLGLASTLEIGTGYHVETDRDYLAIRTQANQLKIYLVGAGRPLFQGRTTEVMPLQDMETCKKEIAYKVVRKGEFYSEGVDSIINEFNTLNALCKTGLRWGIQLRPIHAVYCGDLQIGYTTPIYTGNLQQFLNSAPHLSFHERLFIVDQLLSGLSQVHEAGYVYKMIQIEGIAYFFDQEGDPIVHLTCFHIARKSSNQAERLQDLSALKKVIETVLHPIGLKTITDNLENCTAKESLTAFRAFVEGYHYPLSRKIYDKVARYYLASINTVNCEGV